MNIAIMLSMPWIEKVDGGSTVGAGDPHVHGTCAILECFSPELFHAYTLLRGCDIIGAWMKNKAYWASTRDLTIKSALQYHAHLLKAPNWRSPAGQHSIVMVFTAGMSKAVKVNRTAASLRAAILNLYSFEADVVERYHVGLITRRRRSNRTSATHEQPPTLLGSGGCFLD